MEAIVSNILKRNNEIIENRSKWLKVFAVIGVVVVIAGVAYAIYRHYSDSCCDADYEDEFDEDVAEEFFEED